MAVIVNIDFELASCIIYQMAKEQEKSLYTKFRIEEVLPYKAIVKDHQDEDSPSTLPEGHRNLLAEILKNIVRSEKGIARVTFTPTSRFSDDQIRQLGEIIEEDFKLLGIRVSTVALPYSWEEDPELQVHLEPDRSISK
jgi:hypothetical protein